MGYQEDRIRRRKYGAAAIVLRLRDGARALLRLPFKRLAVHLVTLVLALLTLSLLYNFTQQVMQSANLEAQRAELMREVEALDAENVHLQGVAEYAESDANVERIARERLNYAREGDIVIVPRLTVPTPLPTETTAASEAIPLPTPVPNWQRWWDAFTPDDAYPTGHPKR